MNKITAVYKMSTPSLLPKLATVFYIYIHYGQQQEFHCIKERTEILLT